MCQTELCINESKLHMSTREGDIETNLSLCYECALAMGIIDQIPIEPPQEEPAT